MAIEIRAVKHHCFEVWENRTFLCRVRGITQAETVKVRLESYKTTVPSNVVRPPGYVRRDVPLLDRNGEVIFSTKEDLVRYDVYVCHTFRGHEVQIWYDPRLGDWLACIMRGQKGLGVVGNASLSQLVKNLQDGIEVTV